MYVVIFLVASLYSSTLAQSANTLVQSANTLVQSANQYDLEKAREYFENFIITYNKIYKTEHEKEYRFKIFKENLKVINRFNIDHDGDGAYGINQFTDLTPDEFLNRHTGHCHGNYGYRRNYFDGDEDVIPITDEDIPRVDVPETFDWREKNVVTPVKYQGHCGSCWAFSAAAHLESQYALKYNETISLSEQQIIDCDRQSDGCCGGFTSWAFMAVMKIGGLMLEENYTRYQPENAVKNSCHKDLKKNVIKVTGYNVYKTNSQETVKQILYQKGPLAIAIKATALQLISRGHIITDKQCNVGGINHAVLLVGYGIENNKPYWIVKNSWGTMFDEHGFFRMERSDNPDGACGMLEDFLIAANIEKA